MRRGFLSYSQRNKKWRDAILESLPPKIRSAIWTDTAIKPGEKWFDQIKYNIEQSDTAILLITREFIDSAFIDKHELPKILEKAQAESDVFRILAIACEPFDPEELPKLLEFQWVLGPSQDLLTISQDEAAYKSALLAIRKSIKAHFETSPETQKFLNSTDDTYSSLHLLTGGKGGVGKTLMGLSVFLTYALGFNRPIHGLDLNSMNPDLYRLLAFDKNVDDVDPNWRTSAADVQAHVSVPLDPYILPQGVSGFWKHVQVPLRNSYYDKFSIVVDTNLHIANLYSGNPSPEKQIHDLLSKTSRDIYIWILWTYSSVSDYKIVNRVLRYFHTEYEGRIRPVHVLNPGALMPPTYDINVEINRMAALRTKEQDYRRILEDPLGFPPEGLPYLQQALQNVIDETNDTMNELKDFPKSALTQGLVELWQSKPIQVDFAMHDESFGRILHSELDSFEPLKFVSLKDALEKEYGGRPVNILPVSSHNTNFIGYTEKKNIGITLPEIRNRLSPVYNDVARFLSILLSSPLRD